MESCSNGEGLLRTARNDFRCLMRFKYAHDIRYGIISMSLRYNMYLGLVITCLSWCFKYTPTWFLLLLLLRMHVKHPRC